MEITEQLSHIIEEYHLYASVLCSGCTSVNPNTTVSATVPSPTGCVANVCVSGGPASSPTANTDDEVK